jgi:hypothetical protein
VVLSRISGVSALLFVAGTLLYFGAISPPLGPPEPSASKLVSWTMSHQQQLLFQFVPGYLAVLFAVLIALLVQLNGGRGVLAMLAYVGTGANLAIALVSFGLFFGTWTYIQRGGTSDGVLALATIAPTFTHASLIAQGLAIGCVGVMAVRARVAGLARLAHDTHRRGAVLDGYCIRIRAFLLYDCDECHHGRWHRAQA